MVAFTFIRIDWVETNKDLFGNSEVSDEVGCDLLCMAADFLACVIVDCNLIYFCR